ncbi:Eco57I restriction-modification methylase domain-containing protein [Pedobacter jeongneungensis]|uniref:site-specific DNA-methyltransferase (adenine-specific) n=1 Tax=Pedobacter jeongneungensis TaxID=947309 RepID=A0ABP8BDL8_9SPHI
MQLNKISPFKSLNTSYRKVPVDRQEIDSYKKNLKSLFEKVDKKFDEDHLKYLLGDFLKDTWYKESNQINPIAKNDLVIHLGKLPSHPVGVILEIKSPKNVSEMITFKKPNVKALHELILYYFRERLENKNTELKHLIISNVEEWYIFDANEFDKKIYSNSQIKRLFELKLSDGKLNPFFYEELFKILNSQNDLVLNVTYFTIADIKKRHLENNDYDDALIVPYKILSPGHLLKLPVSNESNALDNDFYHELLHIIGLEEISAGKKVINRKPIGERDPGSFIENTINKIDAVNKIGDLDEIQIYGKTYPEQLFNISLELVITWVNRILFLKLLESQLIKYHRDSKSYNFLNSSYLKNYTDLNDLFFEVLARPLETRTEQVRPKFNSVPYLNSSLFEPTELEKRILTLNNLNPNVKLKIFSSTVLESGGKRLKGSLDPLEYIFKFLGSFNFSSNTNDVIQEEKKSLINASVLGLIFEKINGYKEGSFFTPGRITTFMCRESLRRVVVNKFNGSITFKNKGIKAADFEDLKQKLDFTNREVRQFANELINQVRICDPAVGSGHFLVSALNELIVIKFELGILCYLDGSIIRGYVISNSDDELNIVDEIDEKNFNYILNTHNRTIDSIQKLQVAIFNEKQTLIENCLFGVDINPNSVKICRLRLWIELLKHSYYHADLESGEIEVLETLPNIDINIKVGNSLINKLPLDSSLKNKEIAIKKYYESVKEYQNTSDKNKKKEIENEINNIKNNFRITISKTDKNVASLDKKERDFYIKYDSTQLFSENLDEKRNSGKKKLADEIIKLRDKIEKARQNIIYQNAFEWRIEFPETLGLDGGFSGFDLIIGNPPYGSLIHENEKRYFKDNYSSTQGPFEIYKFFIERSLELLSNDGLLCFITPNTWINLSYFKRIRVIISEKFSLEFCSETLYDVFDEATVDTNIYGISRKLDDKFSFDVIGKDLKYSRKGTIISTPTDSIISLKSKPLDIGLIEENSYPLADIVDIFRGMSAYGAKSEDRPYNSFIKIDENHRPMLNGGDIGKYQVKWAGEYILFGNWLHRSRPERIYTEPHLLIQRIRNPKLKDRLVATYDENRFISSDGLSNILCKKHVKDVKTELKYILGIINSKLINRWFSFYFFDVNIKPEQLRQIPIKKVSESVKYTISLLVEYLLFINELYDVKINEYVPNHHIFQEVMDILDALVYELYFPGEFKEENIVILDNVSNIFYPIDTEDITGSVNIVHQTYQLLRNKDNEVRNNLKLMDIRLASLIMPFKTLS